MPILSTHRCGGHCIDAIVFVEGSADDDGIGEGIRSERGTGMPCRNMMVVCLEGEK